MNRLLPSSLLRTAGILLVAMMITRPAITEPSRAEVETRLADGGPSPQLYYHLAVADEEAGDVVGAAINYQRALILDPGFRIAQNRYAEFAAKNQIGVRPRSWTDDVVAFVHPETLIIFGTILGWIGAIGMAWLIFVPNQPGRRLAACILALVAGSAIFSIGYIADPRIADANLAVVSGSQSTRLHAGPAENSSVLMDLKPGSAVGVISPRGAWTYVITAQGAKGWVASPSLQPVLPESGESAPAS